MNKLERKHVKTYMHSPFKFCLLDTANFLLSVGFFEPLLFFLRSSYTRESCISFPAHLNPLQWTFQKMWYPVWHKLWSYFTPTQKSVGQAPRFL